MNLNKPISQGLEQIKKFFKETRLHKLERRRKKVLDEIALTEKKWLKRELDKKAFRELNEKFHKELITLGAEIEIGKIKERLKVFTEREAKKLSKKRKPVLKKLLGKKEKMLKELDGAKKLYLKRKIDEQSYKSIVKEKQGQLIDIEASINSLYREEAEVIMRKTEEKLAIGEKEALIAEAEEIATDIAEQVRPEKVGEGKTPAIKRKGRRFRRKK